MVVTRELTKVFEEIWRGTLGQAAQQWTAQQPRGEFTLVIAGAVPQPFDLEAAVAAAHEAIESGESMADAVRHVAAATEISRRELYEAVLRAKR